MKDSWINALEYLNKLDIAISEYDNYIGGIFLLH